MDIDQKEVIFNNFLSRLTNDKLKEAWIKDIHFKEKFFDYVYQDLLNLSHPKILEFGVHTGFSTSIFLDICNLNNGELFSVDVDDYSESFKDKNWTFIKSKDDNFDLIEKKIPSKIDVILIDTLHEANHVEKIFYHYYQKLKKNGMVIIDDISWLYYTAKAVRDNFYIETNNRETFFKIIEIFNANMDNINLEFNFAHSGVCKITKKNDLPLIESKKIASREFSIKNLIRKIIRK